MNIATLWTLLEAARAACGHHEYVVVGSLSILGMEQVAAVPPGMTMSIDVNCYTLADPPRIFELTALLGEGSAFHAQHGIYLDPVSPKLPTLPDGWEKRLIRVGYEHRQAIPKGEHRSAQARGLPKERLAAHFLEPHDAAISKLARGEPRDVRWVRAGMRAGMLSLPVLALRMKSTHFLDAAEQQGTAQRVAGLRSKKRVAGW